MISNRHLPASAPADHWTDRAACRAHPAFDPAPDGDEDEARIKRICRACPVREACLEAAIGDEGSMPDTSRWGIRGALNPYERYALHRRRRQQERSP